MPDSQNNGNLKGIDLTEFNEQPQVTRFAPSPTGFLHVGNLRTATIAWMVARKSGGKFILRIDDTDQERSRKEYEEAIIADLKWAGITWDALEHQSLRIERYEEAKQKLIANGRLYPCYETEEELELKKKVLIARGLPPIYDRESLNLPPEKIAQYEQAGRAKHWRFKLEDSEIKWQDGVRGEITFQGSNLSDPVLIRQDGTLTYSLASVVDDIDFGINHIIRGEDHISNSAIHIQLFEALGAQPPRFSHTSLLKMGEKNLSKRDGANSVRELHKEGIFPVVLMSYLSTLGSSQAIHYENSFADIIEKFSLDNLSKSSCNFMREDLNRLNRSYLHHLSYEEVKPYLRERDLEHIDEDFWNIARGNTDHLLEISQWWDICNRPIADSALEKLSAEDRSYLAQAADLFEKTEINDNTWSMWTEKLKSATGRKGKSLFMPLRIALTGLEHGPELPKLLAALGYDKIISRLKLEFKV